MAKSKIMRVDENFYSDIERIIKERVINGKDKVYDVKSASRITLGLTRHPLWQNQIKKDLQKVDMPKERKRR